MAEISDEQYEKLGLILEKKNGESYTLKESKEIGDELIDSYILLMELDSQGY